jgi:hypothetical protein
LRMISSKLGVAMIQVYGLPVARQGNIIDLGFTKLQVVMPVAVYILSFP